MVTVNISDFKTTSMRIRTAVIVTIVTVPGYIVIRTDGWAIIFDTINEQIQNIAQKKDTLCRRMYN